MKKSSPIRFVSFILFIITLIILVSCLYNNSRYCDHNIIVNDDGISTFSSENMFLITTYSDIDNIYPIDSDEICIERNDNKPTIRLIFDTKYIRDSIMTDIASHCY